MILARLVPTMGAGGKIKVCNSRLEEINPVLMTASMLGKAHLRREKLKKVALVATAVFVERRLRVCKE